MKRLFSLTVLAAAFFVFAALQSKADDKTSGETASKEAIEKDKAEKAKAMEKASAIEKIKKDVPEAVWQTQQDLSPVPVRADSAWMLIATALVMLMTPGLALFYGGMARRKNILGTMMHSMVALAIVGVYWFFIGYALAFGDPWIKLPGGRGSVVGFNSELVFLLGIHPKDLLPGTNIPVYLHMMFQGMFAIITPALISGAIAERIRFKPYCIFLILWITFVYCPLAHSVWAMDFTWTTTLPLQHLPVPDMGKVATFGLKPAGWLGVMGALDFAGGTVVHIAAGFSGLAAILVLRKRTGYPKQAIHPSSMVLALLGAGILWFGWFGFNGGSGLASGELAVSAFTATQMAAAAAGLSWMLAEWVHRGKPTALGLASGIVAGLVAVTPASGFVLPWGGLVIGLIAGVVCYTSVSLKPLLGYDDSLDAFGVHGVGGFLGAVLTGFFCTTLANSAGNNGFFLGDPTAGTPTHPGQVLTQLTAAGASAIIAFGLSLVLVALVRALFGFETSVSDESEGLDRTEHGETGFDFGMAMEATIEERVPRAASAPPVQKGRFEVIVEGPPNADLLHAWSKLCQPSEKIPPAFSAVYPYVTTVQGNRFQFRGGDPNLMRDNLKELLQQSLGTAVQARVQTRNGSN